MACSDPETAKNIALFELGLLSSDEEKQRFEAHVVECDECFQSLYKLAPAAGIMRQGKGAPRETIDLTEEVAEDAHSAAARRSRPVTRQTLF